jgi:hypothetical protein
MLSLFFVGFLIISDTEALQERYFYLITYLSDFETVFHNRSSKSFLNKYLNTPKTDNSRKGISFGAWGEFKVDSEPRVLLAPTQRNEDEDKSATEKQAKFQDVSSISDKLTLEEARSALVKWATNNEKNPIIVSNCQVKKVTLLIDLEVS